MTTNTMEEKVEELADLFFTTVCDVAEATEPVVIREVLREMYNFSAREAEEKVLNKVYEILMKNYIINPNEVEGYFNVGNATVVAKIDDFAKEKGITLSDNQNKL